MEPLSSGQEPRTDDPSARPAAHEALTARVLPLLAAEWRAGARASEVPGGFEVEFEDASGVAHVLRAHWQEAGFSSLAHGRRFSVSRQVPGEGSTDAGATAGDRALASSLLSEEDALGAATRPSVDGPAPSAAPSAPGFDLLAQPSAAEALTTWVLAHVPSSERASARVVQSPGGFAVGLPGEGGAWRVLRVREVEPGFVVLAQGRHFDFSYLSPADPADDAAAAPHHQALVEALRANEDAIAAVLQPMDERDHEARRAWEQEEQRRLETLRALEAAASALPPAGAPAVPPPVAEAPPTDVAPARPTFDASSLPASTDALITRVRALLPTERRAAARVLRSPGGFVVEFEDASGVAHVLRAHWQEAGFSSLAHGRRFSVSRQVPGDGSTDAGATAGDRALASSLLSEEDALGAATRPSVDGPAPSAAPSAPGFDLLAQPSAAEALTTWVLAHVPSSERASARVVQSPGGFAVGLPGEGGAWRVLRVREVEPGFVVLAQGRHFDFSYLSPADPADDAAAAARYRAIVEALRADEDALAEDLYPRSFGGARIGADLLAEPSPGASLESLVRALLPADWQEDVRVARARSGFAVGFRDTSGARHVLRAYWLEEGFVALAFGRRFGCSYLDQGAPDAAAVCRGLAEALLAQEEALAAALTSTRHIHGFDLFAAPPSNEVFAARVAALPPAEGRAIVRVVQAHDGFAVELRGASGAHHVLRLQWLEEGFPVLAHGRSVSVSYLKDASGSERVARYREVADGFVQQEAALTRALRPEGMSARGRDLFAPPPVKEALTARVRALLPADWRVDVRAVQVHDGFAVGFRDGSGARHVLLAQWLEEGSRSFVQGRRFGFAYANNDNQPDDAATVARYRDALLAFGAHEDALAADLRAG